MRGKGLLIKSVMEAQGNSLHLTSAYAALISVINSHIPIIGKVLLNRLGLKFKAAYCKQHSKSHCISSATFITHLTNQQVVTHHLISKILSLLMEKPSAENIDILTKVLKEFGIN